MVVLVYLHGRLWRGPGLGLIAAVLTGFNRNLLVQMQQATPTTLALAGVLGGLALLRLAPAGDLGVVRGRPVRPGRAGLLGGARGPGAGRLADGGRPLRPGRRCRWCCCTRCTSAPARPGPSADRPLVARLAGQPEPPRRGAGAGRRAGGGGPLARLDGPPPRVRRSSPRCSRRSTPPAGHSPGLLVRLIAPGPRGAAAGPLRRRPGDPPGPDRRDRTTARSSAGRSGCSGWRSPRWCRRSGRGARGTFRACSCSCR